MFTRTQDYSINSNNTPNRFIESINGVDDIANSTLLYRLDREVTRRQYTVTKYEHRWDLIANELYGSVSYSWILEYTTRIPESQLVRGVTFEYIPLATMKSIISSVV